MPFCLILLSFLVSELFGARPAEASLAFCTSYLSESDGPMRLKFKRAYEELLFERGQGLISQEELVAMLAESAAAPERLFELKEAGSSERGMLRKVLKDLLSGAQAKGVELESLGHDLREMLALRLGVSRAEGAAQAAARESKAEMRPHKKVLADKDSATYHLKALTKDGYLLAADSKFVINTIRISDGKIISRTGPDHFIESFAPGEKFWVAKVDHDRGDKLSFRVYETATGKLVHQTLGPGRFDAKQISENGRYVLYWDRQNARYLDRLHPAPEWKSGFRYLDWASQAEFVTLLADGTLVARLKGSHTLRYDIKNDRILWHRDIPAYHSIVSAGHNYLVFNGTMIVDARTGKNLGEFSNGPPSQHLPRLETTFDGRFLVRGPDGLPAAAMASDKFQIFDRITGVVRTLDVTFSSSPSYYQLTPDGKVLAVADWSHSLSLLDAQNGKLLAKIERDKTRASNFFISPDGRSIIAMEDGKVMVWDIEALIEEEAK